MLGRLRPTMLRRAASLARAFSSAADLFQAKLALGKTLPPLEDNHAKLQMYALFKQATEGKCTTSKPGMLDFVGKAKWEAWTSLGDLSKEAAMQQYCGLIDELAAKAGVGTKAAAAADPADDLVVTKSDAGVLTLQLNRPKKFNAINLGMYTRITEALRADDPTVKVIVLQATGPMFSSGNDLSMFLKTPPAGGVDQLAADAAVLLENFVDAFLTCPKPVVAAVHAPAIGIAVTLLGLCDFVYAHERATFQTPFTALGQAPEACSSVTFPALMGQTHANAMLLLGQKISATTAADRGLVTECFGDDFEAQVATRVRQLTSMYPHSMRESKRLIRQRNLKDLQAVNKAECALLQKLWVAPECMDAIMKFSTRK